MFTIILGNETYVNIFGNFDYLYGDEFLTHITEVIVLLVSSIGALVCTYLFGCDKVKVEKD